MEGKENAGVVPVGYMEEFKDKGVNNDGVFTVKSEIDQGRLGIELPRLQHLQNFHHMDVKVTTLVPEKQISETDPTYSSVFAGARNCVECIVGSIATAAQDFEVIEAGSAFEDLQVKEPIEFDFMLCDKPMKHWPNSTVEHNDTDTQLEGQFKNGVVGRIYKSIDSIRFPTGWELYRPTCDREKLEQKYKPVEFDHPSCQMHKRGTKVWFTYSGQMILIDIVPCRRLDQGTQLLFHCYYRNSVPAIQYRSAEILSFCYRALDCFDEVTLQSHMNNVSTSLLEKKILSDWPEEIRKLLRVVKLYCQTHNLISSDPRRLVSDNTGYIDSYILKTLFIRIILEMEEQGIRESNFATISPSRFLCYFVTQLHGIFTDCQSKCQNSTEEYHVRFYHCFIAEEHLKRVSVKWRPLDFQRLSEKCQNLLDEFKEHPGQNGPGPGITMCKMGDLLERPDNQTDYSVGAKSVEVMAKTLFQDPLYELSDFDYSISLEKRKTTKPKSRKQKQHQVARNSKSFNNRLKSRTENKQQPLVSLAPILSVNENISAKREGASFIKSPTKPTFADVVKSCN